MEDFSEDFWEQMKDIIEQAHMAGQHAADPNIGNASYYDAMSYAKNVLAKAIGKVRKGAVMRIYKEKPGIISKDEVWVCIHNNYLYIADTLHELIEILNTEWGDSIHFAGGYSDTNIKKE